MRIRRHIPMLLGPMLLGQAERHRLRAARRQRWFCGFGRSNRRLTGSRVSRPASAATMTRWLGVSPSVFVVRCVAPAPAGGADRFRSPCRYCRSCRKGRTIPVPYARRLPTDGLSGATLLIPLPATADADTTELEKAVVTRASSGALFSCRIVVTRPWLLRDRTAGRGTGPISLHSDSGRRIAGRGGGLLRHRVDSNGQIQCGDIGGAVDPTQRRPVGPARGGGHRPRPDEVRSPGRGHPNQDSTTQ